MARDESAHGMHAVKLEQPDQLMTEEEATAVIRQLPVLPPASEASHFQEKRGIKFEKEEVKHGEKASKASASGIMDVWRT